MVSDRRVGHEVHWGVAKFMTGNEVRMGKVVATRVFQTHVLYLIHT